MQQNIIMITKGPCSLRNSKNQEHGTKSSRIDDSCFLHIQMKLKVFLFACLVSYYVIFLSTYYFLTFVKQSRY